MDAGPLPTPRPQALFSARGALPRDMHEVPDRQKDIPYSSRTRLVIDYLLRQHRHNQLLKRTLDQLADEALDDEQMAAKQRLSDMPQFTILQMTSAAHGRRDPARQPMP